MNGDARICRVAGCGAKVRRGYLCDTCWKALGWDCKAAIQAEPSKGGKARLLAQGIERLEKRRAEAAGK